MQKVKVCFSEKEEEALSGLDLRYRRAAVAMDTRGNQREPTGSSSHLIDGHTDSHSGGVTEICEHVERKEWARDDILSSDLGFCLVCFLHLISIFWKVFLFFLL